ncbi:MAG: Ig-like domain-containing protein, partial [Candidatus Wenzhouxiangella sp. M2_3B_020]
SDGSFSYAPSPGFNGSDSFTYRASDGNGGLDTAVVAIEVAAVADAPVLSEIEDQVTDEDTPLTIPFTVADADTPVGELVVAVAAADSQLVPPTGLTLTGDESARKLRIGPTPDSSGTTEVTITVTDGVLASSTTFALTVRSVNDAPVAMDDAATTDEDVPVTVDVLANDRDDELLDPGSLRIVDEPEHGTAEVERGVIIYTPASEYAGRDTLTYRVDDEGGLASNEATLALTVSMVDDAPIAAADSASTPAGVKVVVPVLANDVDPEGSSLRLEAVEDPTGGTATIIGDSAISYMPDSGFLGVDRFAYTVVDQAGGEAEGLVWVNVTACTYTITDLGTLGGSLSRGLGINEAGEVVGLSETAVGRVQAYLWTSSGMVPLGGGTGQAHAIDDVIVGGAVIDGTLRAARLGTDVDDLGAPTGAFGMAYGVRDGVAVGTFESDGLFHPFTTRNGFTLLPTAADTHAVATGINAADVKVGFDAQGQALRWSAAGDVSVIGEGQAQSINAAGEVVGAHAGDAVLWKVDGTIVDLDPEDVGFDVAYAVTDEGIIVGAGGGSEAGKAASKDFFASLRNGEGVALQAAGKSGPGGRAYLWIRGTLVDLNECGAADEGWTLVEARDVNAAGQIVGTGVRDGQQRAFVLSPAGNAAPQTRTDVASMSDEASIVLDVLANDGDPDGDELHIVRTVRGSGRVEIDAGGALIYRPAAGFSGTDRFAYTVTDGRGAAAHGTVEVVVAPKAPETFGVEQNYPNPFATSTRIEFDLPEAAEVRMDVYDTLGRHVRTLANRRYDAGGHHVIFDAAGLASGTYIYRLTAGGHAAVRTLMLIR